MKLSEIRSINHRNISSLNQGLPTSYNIYGNDQGIDLSNFYQELEMDSPYVDTHRDVSYSNDNVQFHSHAFYELICCRNSCGAEYLVGTDRYKLQRGDVIFVPPGISHRPLLPDSMQEPYLRDVLWISEEFMNGVSSSIMNVLPEEFHQVALYRTVGTRWEVVCELFQKGILEAEAGETSWELAVIGNTLSILSLLHRAALDMRTKPLRAEKPELLNQVLAYVELHLSEKITLADIAHHFFISESTITQTFRKKMGVSFYRCVTQRRLISAKALIEQGLPLESVAEQVGFSDYSSFFRAFKQEYGISPRQYKKLHAVSIENR